MGTCSKLNIPGHWHIKLHKHKMSFEKANLLLHFTSETQTTKRQWFSGVFLSSQECYCWLVSKLTTDPDEHSIHTRQDYRHKHTLKKKTFSRTSSTSSTFIASLNRGWYRDQRVYCTDHLKQAVWQCENRSRFLEVSRVFGGRKWAGRRRELRYILSTVVKIPLWG